MRNGVCTMAVVTVAVSLAGCAQFPMFWRSATVPAPAAVRAPAAPPAAAPPAPVAQKPADALPPGLEIHALGAGRPDSAPAAAPAARPSREVALADYVEHVRRRIRAAMRYKSAPSRKDNPAATFRVTLLPNLTVHAVKLVKSSGDRRFDAAVERAIAHVGRYPALPDGLDFSLIQTHTIKYRLRDVA